MGARQPAQLPELDRLRDYKEKPGAFRCEPNEDEL